MIQEEVARIISAGIASPLNPEKYVGSRTMASQIHQKYIEDNWVQLADNQELPSKPESYDDYYAEWQRYDQGQQDMFTPSNGEVWKKVKC